MKGQCDNMRLRPPLSTVFYILFKFNPSENVKMYANCIIIHSRMFSHFLFAEIPWNQLIYHYMYLNYMSFFHEISRMIIFYLAVSQHSLLQICDRTNSSISQKIRCGSWPYPTFSGPKRNLTHLPGGVTKWLINH